jgi:hypothetical protein
MPTEKKAFDHPNFEVFTPDTLQPNTEMLLQDEIYIADYQKLISDLDNGKPWKSVGYVSFVTVARKTPHSIELSFCSDRADRVHDFFVSLPNDQIVDCVRAWKWDERPTLFVKSQWLEKILMRSNCIFGLIDAIGVGEKLTKGIAIDERLLKVRSGLDKIASRYSQIFFVSFSDSVLLKSHWSLGFFKTGVRYSYDPESFIHVFEEVKTLFKEALNLGVYGVFTQGINEYYNESLRHISESENHVCLNSIGAPFADLFAIEESARQVHKEMEKTCDLYLDESYFKSLKLNAKFRQSVLDWHSYNSRLRKAEAWYACVTCDEILQNLKPVRAQAGQGGNRVAVRRGG